jgi:hypothetical protein
LPACMSGWKFKSATALWTRSMVVAETWGSPLMTRLTVLTPTPAKVATSRIVERLVGPDGVALELDTDVTVYLPIEDSA